MLASVRSITMLQSGAKSGQCTVTVLSVGAGQNHLPLSDSGWQLANIPGRTTKGGGSQSVPAGSGISWDGLCHEGVPEEIQVGGMRDVGVGVPHDGPLTFERKREEQ